MGTNYYLEPTLGGDIVAAAARLVKRIFGSEDAPDAKRNPPRLHIGKASAGWTFLFHGTGHVQSWREWREILTLGRIRDEYGDALSLAEFERLVASKAGEPHNHARNYPGENTWQDEEGHAFQGGTFQ